MIIKRKKKITSGYNKPEVIFLSYENYKRARNASWECLINCSIDKLPTDLSQICHYYGIHIIKNSDLTTNKLTADEKGKVVIVPPNKPCQKSRSIFSIGRIEKETDLVRI